MNLKPQWNDIDWEELENSEKNLPHYHFVHYKFHID
jgi:hypothetical protein